MIANTTEDGLYTPAGIQKSRFIFFAIDNSDFSEDTPDGKHTTHATATAIFQHKLDCDVNAVTIPTKTSTKSLQSSSEMALLSCAMSTKTKPKSPKYEAFVFGVNEELLINF